MDNTSMVIEEMIVNRLAPDTRENNSEFLIIDRSMWLNMDLKKDRLCDDLLDYFRYVLRKQF
jgi:hypothetical protein